MRELLDFSQQRHSLFFEKKHTYQEEQDQTPDLQQLRRMKAGEQCSRGKFTNSGHLSRNPCGALITFCDRSSHVLHR